jgi:hypothetical protein
MIAFILMGLGLSFPRLGKGEIMHVVYNIHQGLDLGFPNESPKKDYYLNMGSTHGVKVGSILQVVRRISTYNLVNDHLYKDVAFPIALVKVIHVEPAAAIARIEKWLPSESTPGISPKAVMLGDFVRFPEN